MWEDMFQVMSYFSIFFSSIHSSLNSPKIYFQNFCLLQSETCDLHLLVNFMYFQLWRRETARQSIVPIILNLWKWGAVYIIAVIFRSFKLWELLESALKSHQQCLIYSGGLQRKNSLFLKHYVNPIFFYIFRNSW